jgi:GYF domain 2
MPVRWYYQNQASVVGPVSVTELKYLINGGAIGLSTLVRRGEDSPWLAANKAEGLLTAAGESENADGSAPEIPEWYFNLQGQNKQGPVPWSVLKAMSAERKFQPDDLVWKPGMALWVPASQVQGLMGGSADAAIQEPGLRSALRLRGRSHVLWAGAAATLLLGLIAGSVFWKWTRTQSDRPNTRVARDRALANKGGRLKDAHNPVEQVLDDARTAVRLEQLERATRLLDQYLASLGSEQAEAAKRLLHEIKLSTSVSEAARLAQNLPDEALKTYLQRGVQTLVVAIETLELRPTYESTLLRAFREENNRRQMIPRDAIAQNPNVVEEAPNANDPDVAPAKPQDPPARPKLSILGQAGPAARGPAGNPDPQNDAPRLSRRPGVIPADLEFVLAKPGEFGGNTLVLNGLFKIGTKLSEVRGPDGQVLGRSLPIARNDDSMVCTGESMVEKHGVFLLLDDRLAKFLDHVFKKLHLRPTIKPSYRCILTVMTRRLLVNGSPTPVIVISSMEVLGGCNYVSVARHQYSQAFRTLTVTPDEADVDFGDGDLWVERLGGEENFVQPIRRKFRDMQRRAVTNRDSAVIDSILRRELANVVSRATAINQIVAMEGLRRMRIWP